METGISASSGGGSCGGQTTEMEILNPLNDSSLTALLDELQEGTLLSLLEDDHLFSDLQNYPLSPTNPGENGVNLSNDDFPLEELFGDHCQLVELGFGELDTALRFQGSQTDNAEPNLAKNNKVKLCKATKSCMDFEIKPAGSSSDLIEQTQTNKSGADLSQMTEPLPENRTPKGRKPAVKPSLRAPRRKRPKISQMKKVEFVHSESDTDSSSVDSDEMECEEVNRHPNERVSPLLMDRRHLLACVQHDHCYASCSKDETPEGQRSPASVEGDNSIEEGSGSDAGYDTMSASTSPGSSSTTSGSRTSPSPKVLSSPKTSPSPVTLSTVPTLPLPPLGVGIDPVALIDARIKHFMSSRQINLTEEEKETLKAEGLPIPTTLPLTKIEEKALKSVRRKIRNKMAAQESRKRKKEQLYTLESKVELCTSENLWLKKKVETLESENRSLMTQLKKLQAIVARCPAMANTSRTTQVGACLMVVVLCFAIFFGSWTPHKSWNTPASDYATATVRSRSLLSLDHRQDFHQAACDWFRHIFMREPPPTVVNQEIELEEQDPYDSWLSHHGTHLYTAVTPLTFQGDNDTRDSHTSAKA